MYDSILIPTDGNAGADVALEHAGDIARHFDATAYVLNVANTNRDSLAVVQGDVVDVLETEGERIVSKTASRLRDMGVQCETEVVQGDPAGTIAEYATTREMDLVVMPTHGRRGLTRYLLGSVTEKVVRLAEVPVLTVQMHEDARTSFPYENVLLPTDGSKPSLAAAERAIALAAALAATLHVVSVVDVESVGIDVRSGALAAEFETQSREAVDEVVERATEGGVDDVVDHVLKGRPHKKLLSYVDENDVDLVAMGTHGRRGMDRIAIGSVTERIVRSSRVPVLTVRT